MNPQTGTAQTTTNYNPTSATNTKESVTFAELMKKTPHPCFMSHAASEILVTHGAPLSEHIQDGRVIIFAETDDDERNNQAAKKGAKQYCIERGMLKSPHNDNIIKMVVGGANTYFVSDTVPVQPLSSKKTTGARKTAQMSRQQIRMRRQLEDHN